MLTWKKLKYLMESNGVRDDDIIQCLEIPLNFDETPYNAVVSIEEYDNKRFVDLGFYEKK